jgi:hypothetical protein
VLAVLGVADAALLAHTIATLRAQGYERWELCLAMPAAVRTALRGDLEPLLASEPRLRVAESDGDTATYADAYRLARGEAIAVLTAGDELAPDALVELVRRLDEEPLTDLVYSDEDAITGSRRDDPIFKPDWSPDLLLSMNYLERFGLLRRRIRRGWRVRPRCGPRAVLRSDASGEREERSDRARAEGALSRAPSADEPRDRAGETRGEPRRAPRHCQRARTTAQTRAS